MNRIDFGFVARALGQRATEVRLPDREGRHGLRVGKRLDLATVREADLHRAGLPSSLRRKLRPYLGKTGAELQAATRWQPVRLTANEQGAIIAHDNRRAIDRLAAMYMGAATNRGRRSFGTLPANAQTALAVVFLHAGGRPDRLLPEVWRASTAQDWAATGDALRRRRVPAAEALSRLFASAA
ncbi:pesticin C-terminus-like muramidase [Salinisphaera sp. Q1T1-3]|uniref:pesticin C-terminus-like muramidase n=1 Tax=Salinisphaera sp. Q1T1-3 TaxID=2321229 RepID=UPI000E719ADC|nr:pesticin C-terminus-like muramidase [Salinisphaera sp. Q1T1-3]RJS91695.1 hypothetical protein D3260_14715 [Salinisphaera sp. Q1T1-3]